MGYRAITGVGGDVNTYRSVVNLGDGPKLFGLDATIQEPSRRFFDRIDIRANSWGGDPYNTARIEARKQGIYDFTWDYRNIAYYDFLPSFADPTKASGVFLDQQGFNTFLRSSDFELDLFPGRRIIPYVAYSREGRRGDGTTDFVLQENEYAVPTLYDDHTNVYRAGIRFEYTRFHVTLEQGAFNFSDDQQVSSGAVSPNPGNLTTPFLGQQLFLTSGQEAYGVRADGMFSKALFTANPAPWIDLYGQFLYSDARTKTNFTANAAGNIFDFTSFAFYTGLIDSLGALARAPHPSGSAGFELRPLRRVRILESWMTDRMHDASSALLNEQLLLAGGAPVSPTAALTSSLFVVNYNQQEVNVLFDATSKLTLRVGHRYIWGDTSEPPALVFEGQGLTRESAQLSRNVALGGLVFRAAGKLRISADLEASPGDHAFFRTSLNDYQRGIVRARYQFSPELQFAAQFSVLNNQNPAPAIRLDTLSRYNTVSAYWTPAGGKKFSLLAEYARSTLRSRCDFLTPSTLTPGVFFYRDNAHTGTLLADIPLTVGSLQPKLSFGGSFFVSSGSRPMRFYEPQAKVSVPIRNHVQWYTEWRWYAMSQPFYLYEGFRSQQFVIGLHAAM